MKFYEIIYSDEDKSNDIISYSEDNLVKKIGINRYEIDKGRNLKIKGDINFYYDKEEGDVFVDYICNNYGWIIISEKMKNLIIIKQTIGLQLFPVNLIERKTKEITLCWLVNFTELQDCVNLEKSVYKIVPIVEEVFVIKPIFNAVDLTDCHFFKFISRGGGLVYFRRIKKSI